jgi:hypothetical protein
VWIIERFGAEYPHDLVDRDVLNDAITGHFDQWSLAVYQCENCGRLWVQEEPYTNRYRPFHPEGEWRDTLLVRKTAQSAQSGHEQE